MNTQTDQAPTLRDLALYCRECGRSFAVTPGEQRFFLERSLQIPKRCAECRRVRRAQADVAERTER